jgi:hypothetical protein
LLRTNKFSSRLSSVSFESFDKLFGDFFKLFSKKLLFSWEVVLYSLHSFSSPLFGQLLQPSQ